MQNRNQAKNRVSLIPIALFIILFFGCIGKQQVRVEDLGISIPATWNAPFPQSQKVSGNWWSIFNDPMLDSFLFRLKTESPDIKTLVQNQELAIQNAKLGGASIFPSINISTRADTNVQNLSGFGFADSFFNSSSEDDSSGNSEQPSNEVLTFGNKNFGLGLNLQWEVDIWGRLMNGRKAAYKDYESITYDLSYLQFSIMIRSAQLFFNAKEAASQLELSEESYNSLVEIRDLVKERYEKGLRSSLDYRLAETSVATSIVSIENSKSILRSLNRQIEILTGDYPSGTFINKSSLPTALPLIPVGMPASIIQRRPDIRSLVLKMEAASHRVAQSTRDLLPGITINGSAGTSTQDIEKIFDVDHGVWNLGMSVTAPIFNGGRLRSIKKIQESNYENSKQELIRGILKAFSEIEQFLDQNKSLSIQNEALEIAVKQSKDAYELSIERYDKGVTTLESVLNSQRQYNAIRSQQLTIRRQSIENRLSLVLAMGGELKKE
tara:strand:+ start:433 stop:1914 length:1482 start_codon:yes stop_codon:yes gene_type:complete